MNIKVFLIPFLMIGSGAYYTYKYAMDGVTDPLMYLVSVGLIIGGLAILIFFRSKRS